MRNFILMMLSYLVIGQFSISYSLEKETHRSINQYISEGVNSVFSLDTYLKNNLGFTKGKDELLNGQKVYDWVSNGGKFEDEPAYTRSRNHFHNPLLSRDAWDQAGLNIFPFTGQSSALWIQNQKDRRWTDLGGDWSWKKARQFYYAALTGDSTAQELNGFKVEESWGNSTTIVGKSGMSEEERNRFFAWTFRAVGQTMHLVQDASVPSHTRPDVHIFWNYESWVDAQRKDNMTGFQKLFETPKSFSGTITNAASFIDTDKYSRDNPGDTASTAIGLAEYTNANFFSEDTVFAKEYPYPSRKTSVQVKDYDYPDPFYPGTYVKREYYKKVADGETNGETGYRLAGVDYLRFYRKALDPLAQDELESMVIPPMDDFVYEDYAKLLLPRAVGYSAGLLNYFFRGKISMSKAPNDPGQFIINNDSGEEMSGTFSLYYDDTDGNRNQVEGAVWDMSIAANGYSAPVTFAPPSLPKPKEKGTYVLVFKGTMGNEAGAVVGKVVTLEADTRLYFQIMQSYGQTTFWDLENDKEVRLTRYQNVPKNPDIKDIGMYDTGVLGANTHVEWRATGDYYDMTLTNNGTELGTNPYNLYLEGLVDPFAERSMYFSGEGKSTNVWRYYSYNPKTMINNYNSFSVHKGWLNSGSISRTIKNGIMRNGFSYSVPFESTLKEFDAHSEYLIRPTFYYNQSYKISNCKSLERGNSKAYFGIFGDSLTEYTENYPIGGFSGINANYSYDAEYKQNFEVFSVTNGRIKNRITLPYLASYKINEQAKATVPGWPIYPVYPTYVTSILGNWWAAELTTSINGSIAYITQVIATANSYHPSKNWVATIYKTQNCEWIMSPSVPNDPLSWKIQFGGVNVVVLDQNGDDLVPVDIKSLTNLNKYLRDNPYYWIMGFVQQQ